MSVESKFVQECYETNYWPQDEQSIIDWLYENVSMDSTSPIQGPYDIENSPQLKEPLQSFQDEDVRMVTTIGPNQGGRTKAMEAASLWAIVNRPGPMQWNTYKDDKAKQFAEQRWWPAAKSCEQVVEKMPAHGTGLTDQRHKERIQGVIFTDGMPFTIQGCAPSNLEESSIMTQFNDECWQWPIGRLETAHIRCNVAYAWNYKVWNGSVAGVDGDEIDLFFRSGTQKEWHWHCPKCGRLQLPKWGRPKKRGGIHWERDAKTKPHNREWDYIEVAKTVRYECEHCKADYDDNARIRRILNESAVYKQLNPKAPYQFQSFRFNILSVNWPGLTWAQWVVEFLKAVEQSKRYGNHEPLKIFWTRRMTESWDESKHIKTTQRIVLSDYNLADRNYKTEKWEREHIRFISCDKQEWGYPFVIRACAVNGDSRLIGVGVTPATCLTSYDEIELKAKEYGIPPQCVLIDSGYETREVYAQAAKRGWTCMRGVDRAELFRHLTEIVDPVTKLIRKVAIELPYSTLQWADPFTGTEQQQLNRRQRIAAPILAKRYDWMNLHIKNLLSAFKQGAALYWGVPGDVGHDYMKQINSEVRHVIVSARGKRTEWWSNSNAKGTGMKRANHGWDCECQIVVAMCLQKLINLGDWKPENASEESD